MTKETLEVELKLLIDQEGHQVLLEKLSVENSVLQQTNHFFDTQDGVLSSARWALRCRQENSDYFLTCKGPDQSLTEGVSSRVEIESPTTPSTLERLNSGTDLLSVDHPATQQLLKMFGNLEVLPYLSFQNLRRRIPYRGLLLELDHSSCSGHQRYEIEIECSESELLRVTPLLEKDLKDWGISFNKSVDSKMKWAIQHSKRTS